MDKVRNEETIDKIANLCIDKISLIPIFHFTPNFRTTASQRFSGLRVVGHLNVFARMPTVVIIGHNINPFMCP